MSKGISPNPENINKWLVQNLRLTLFQTNNQTFDFDTNWWRDLVGEEPEQKIVKPREGKYFEQGPYGNGHLIFEVNFDRIDWRWAKAKASETDFEFPNIGLFKEESEKFVSLFSKWLENSPPLKRMAFGGVFYLPVSDRTDGYKEIANYLPFIKLDPNSSDFQYSINRPRRSKIIGLDINRYSKWSVGLLKKLHVDARTEESKLQQQFSAIILELDINSKVDSKVELPTESLQKIFQELFDLGKEIIQTGDTK